MSENTGGQQFKGFPDPQENWFKTPHQLIDMCADNMKERELKVTLYILRHTWGYQEYDVPKRISTDEFLNGRKRSDGTRMDGGCGLSSKTSVIEGLRDAEQRGTVIAETDNSDKGRIEKLYRLRRASDDQNLDADVQNLDRGVQNLDIRGSKSGHRTEKDTLEINSKKESSPSAKASGRSQKYTKEENNRRADLAIAHCNYLGVTVDVGYWRNALESVFDKFPDMTKDEYEVILKWYSDNNPSISKLRKPNTIIEQIYLYKSVSNPAKKTGQRVADPDCPHCGGDGIVGEDRETRTPIYCTCIHEAN